MFGEVGRAYVYLIYGIHYCLNVSARDFHSGAGAVLLRGIVLQSDQGGPQSSGALNPATLVSGPGNLTKAFKVKLEDNGIDMTHESSALRIEKSQLAFGPESVVATGRIGITKNIDKKWRFVYEPPLGSSSLISPRANPARKGRQTL